MKLLRTEYRVTRNGHPEVWLFLRDGGERRVVKDYSLRPYFYVPTAEVYKLEGQESVTEVELNDRTAIDGVKVRRIFVREPSDVPPLREMFDRTYEADVPFALRYMIDRVDSIEQTTPRVMLFDIEVDSTGRVPLVEDADNAVVCMSVYDSLLDCYTTWAWRADLSPHREGSLVDGRFHDIRWFRSEEDMFDDFLGFVEQETPDVISGYYSNGFDLPYILNRLLNLQRYGESFDGEGRPIVDARVNGRRLSPMGTSYVKQDGLPVIKGIALLDWLTAYRHLTENEAESYRLEYIAQQELGDTKLPVRDNTHLMWCDDIEGLVAYNVKDVSLVRRLDEKRQLLSFLDEIRRVAQCQLEDTTSMTRVADTYILHMFHGETVFPTKERHEHTDYEGAFVGRWATGVLDRVACFDLKSLYPSIIVSANLSPFDTVVEEPGPTTVTICGVNIEQSFTGFLPQVIQSLFEDRAKYQKMKKTEPVNSERWRFYDDRQRAYKIIMNAIYGQTAFVGGRYHDPRVASTITYIGREISQWSRDFLSDLGFRVVYGDTDSVHVVIDERDIQGVELLRQLLNRSYDRFAAGLGLKTHIFQIEFEKLYGRVFYANAKKRYAGNVVWKDGKTCDLIEARGLEVRRSDSSRLSKAILNRILEMLLRENASRHDIVEYVRSQVERVRKGQVSMSEIGIPKGISKGINEYPKPGANIRAVKWMMEERGVYLSNKPKMLYVLGTLDNMTDVVAFDEESQIPPGIRLDAEKMLEKVIRDKIKGIFEALDWRLSEVDWSWRRRERRNEVPKEQLSLGV